MHSKRQTEFDGGARCGQDDEAAATFCVVPSQQGTACGEDVNENIKVFSRSVGEALGFIGIVEAVVVGIVEAVRIGRAFPEVNEAVGVDVGFVRDKIGFCEWVHAIIDFEAIREAVRVCVGRARVGLVLEFFKFGQAVGVAVDVGIGYEAVAVCPLLPLVGDAVIIGVGVTTLPPSGEAGG